MDLDPFKIFLILFLVLLLVGAKKLPDLARGLGQAKHEFKKAAADPNAINATVVPPPNDGTPPPS